MTTYYDFVPPTKRAFQFRPTLNSVEYNAYIRYNIFGKRWYLQLYDMKNNLIVACSVVGSPPPQNVAAASWDAASQIATLGVSAHGFPVGEIVVLTVAGMSGFNGTFEMLARTPDELSYSLSINPGSVDPNGNVAFNNNLIEGYVDNASIVFRTADNRYEVN